MKNLLGGLVNIIEMMILIFICSVFTLSEIQLMSARHLHTSVVNQIQSSYYQLSDSEINSKIQEKFPNWYVETETVKAVADRQDRLVTLHYKVAIPLFNIEKDGRIDGYAR